jgi:hypothetical protein
MRVSDFISDALWRRGETILGAGRNSSHSAPASGLILSLSKGGHGIEAAYLRCAARGVGRPTRHRPPPCR